MLDHIVVNATQLEVSRPFYEQALAPLGMSVLYSFPGTVGFGRDGKPWFWIRQGEVRDPVHVAFTSPDRDTVDAFHDAAWGPGRGTTAVPACARSTTLSTTGPSSWIPTATTSRQSATPPPGEPSGPRLRTPL